MNDRQALFFRQASSDWRMFQWLRSRVNRRLCEVCHALHYLQMAVEKLSKSYFLRAGPIRHSHKYFSKFWRALLTANRVRRALGYGNSEAYRNRLLLAEGLAARIEELAPDLAGQGPNTEYPWPEPDYQHAPAGFHFPIWGRIDHGQDGAILLEIVDRLFAAAPNSF